MDKAFIDKVAASDMAAIKELRDATRLELNDVSERFEHICKRFNECASELETLRTKVMTERDKQGWSAKTDERRLYTDVLRGETKDELLIRLNTLKNAGINR